MNNNIYAMLIFQYEFFCKLNEENTTSCAFSFRMYLVLSKGVSDQFTTPSKHTVDDIINRLERLPSKTILVEYAENSIG